jgi:hypothetical protein
VFIPRNAAMHSVPKGQSAQQSVIALCLNEQKPALVESYAVEGNVARLSLRWKSTGTADGEKGPLRNRRLAAASILIRIAVSSGEFNCAASARPFLLLGNQLAAPPAAVRVS